ncbi:MAG: hypothetical protein QOG80_3262 [Pseudonocardiales bacterium]|nr:hypothetical protein [Pseudonocardiales bacterium]
MANALKLAIKFIAARPGDATLDDDVAALEGISAELAEVDTPDLNRLLGLLGPEIAEAIGLSGRLHRED